MTAIGPALQPLIHGEAWLFLGPLAIWAVLLVAVVAILVMCNEVCREASEDE